MLNPDSLMYVAEEHLADLRRKAEATRLVDLAEQAPRRKPATVRLQLPRLTWPALLTPRRRHAAL
jgi:hypothetical protein